MLWSCQKSHAPKPRHYHQSKHQSKKNLCNLCNLWAILLLLSPFLFHQKGNPSASVMKWFSLAAVRKTLADSVISSGLRASSASSSVIR